MLHRDNMYSSLLHYLQQNIYKGLVRYKFFSLCDRSYSYHYETKVFLKISVDILIYFAKKTFAILLMKKKKKHVLNICLLNYLPLSWTLTRNVSSITALQEIMCICVCIFCTFGCLKFCTQNCTNLSAIKIHFFFLC